MNLLNKKLNKDNFNWYWLLAKYMTQKTHAYLFCTYLPQKTYPFKYNCIHQGKYTNDPPYCSFYKPRTSGDCTLSIKEGEYLYPNDICPLMAIYDASKRHKRI